MVHHTLSLLERSPYASGLFVCNLCWEKGCGPVYHCQDCDFDIHLTCAADAKQQTHFSHYRHPLHLRHCSRNHKCNSCGEVVHRLAFRCDRCDFDIHSLCVRSPRFILHPSHSHPLMLLKSPEHQRPCDACAKVTTRYSYQCRSCNYSLHQFCATLPSGITHQRHPQHMLKLLWKPLAGQVVYTCGQCGEGGVRWRFHCPACHFSVHPQCTNISHEFTYPGTESSFEEKRNVASRSSPGTSAMHNHGSHVPPLSGEDLEAVEKVLRFAREVVNGPSTQASHESSTSDEQATGS